MDIVVLEPREDIEGTKILQRIRKHVCKKSDGDVKVSPKYELKDDSTNNKIDSSQEAKIST